MCPITIYVKHERYSDVDYFTPKVTVDNMLTLESYESDFLDSLCNFVNNYWKEIEKNG